uniref:Flavin-containing monooxygenase n=1 Tax=Vitis vinifera TaxID=29760 RepID=F6GYB2_VITVI
MHSHNYRIPDPFRDLVVILRGVGSSALDISMNIAQVAKEVHIASRSTKVGVLGNMFGYDNLRLHPMIESIHRDGFMIFNDGSVVFCRCYSALHRIQVSFPFS